MSQYEKHILKLFEKSFIIGLLPEPSPRGVPVY